MTESLREGAERLPIPDPKSTMDPEPTADGNTVTAIQRQKAHYLAALAKHPPRTEKASSAAQHMTDVLVEQTQEYAPLPPRRMLKTEHKVWSQQVSNAQHNVSNFEAPLDQETLSDQAQLDKQSDQNKKLNNEDTKPALYQSPARRQYAPSATAITHAPETVSAHALEESTSPRSPVLDDKGLSAVLERIHLTSHDEHDDYAVKQSTFDHIRTPKRSRRAHTTSIQPQSKTGHSQTWLKHTASTIVVISVVVGGLFVYKQESYNNLMHDLFSVKSNLKEAQNEDQTISDSDSARVSPKINTSSTSQAISNDNVHVAPIEPVKHSSEVSLGDSSVHAIDTNAIYEQLLEACHNGRLDPKHQANTALYLLSSLESAKADTLMLLRARSRIAQAYLENARVARQNNDWSRAEKLVSKAIEIRKTSP
ncbi:MAG: hypothetical protein P8176_11055 [Gammaproteobacteria bacterium]